MVYKTEISWDATYDVIIIGFGGTGAGTARFAADSNTKVLLIDAAPEGSEGGNTKYTDDTFAWRLNFSQLKEYYKQTCYPFECDEEALDTFTKDVTQMKEYSKKYSGIEAQPTDRRSDGEYPEYKDATSIQSQSMTKGTYNGGFWKLLRKQVFDRLDKIDVQFESSTKHLIQDSDTNAVIGAIIKRNNREVNIATERGVILSLGDFENNQSMVQDFLGQGSLAPIGILYNRGKGIDLVVGASTRLQYVSNYGSHGLSLRRNEPQEKFAYMINWKSLFNGSIFIAGDNGTRYFREDEENRHGCKYDHGNRVMVPNQNHPHTIVDQAQYEQLSNDQSAKADQIKELISYAIEADSIEELSKKIDAPYLGQAVEDFNFLADVRKRDMFLNRKIETMRSLKEGPYYAIPVRHSILHTHDGAQGDSKCEVTGLNGKAIPNLYETGELGDIFATKYLGANSIAGLSISGKIAGTNAAKIENNMTLPDAVAGASQVHEDLKSDAHQVRMHFEAGRNQGIGSSDQRINDLPIVVRVTLDENQNLRNIETFQEKESGDLGGQAIPKLTQEMLDHNSTDVDLISGANTTSRTFKDAVKQTIENARKSK